MTTTAVAALEARGIAVSAEGVPLVRPTTLAVPPGHLMALIGPSGAGKTTLLRALAGVAEPSAGTVLVGGEPLWRRSTEVGYVPSADLLHDQLTVREALGYAAMLRAPASAGSAELAERVEEVLADLRMTELAEARVATLSTGQRRRASVGVELVGRPQVLLLDEPAGGLDAGLERRLMDLLRRLADEGRGVLAATHATASLGLCDSIAVMGPGGTLRVVGAPEEVLDHFGVSTFEEVYARLERDAEEAPAVSAEPEAGPPVAPAPVQPAQPLGYQVGLLAGRYARCVVRDRKLLRLLLVQAPIIGAAIGLVLPRGVLDSSTLGPYYGVLVCFLVLTGSIWLGTISSCREIVKERAIVEREAAVGLRLDAYFVAKIGVLLPLVATQVVLLVLAVELFQSLPGGFGIILLTCIAAGVAAAAIGLWLSAFARTPDQATSSVPLLLIPQLLFAGALIPVARMPVPLQAIADVTVSRWALAGLGNAMSLDVRLNSDVGSVTGYDPDFFSIRPLLPVFIMVAITLVALSGTGLALDRRISR